MRIEKLMSQPAITCRADDTLARAAQLMWDHDIGSVVVTTPDGRLVGIVTDRDIAMATYTRGAAPADIRVENAMAREVFSCSPSDSVAEAQHVMSDKRVRRLPVVTLGGVPMGMVSINDVVRENAGSAKRNGAHEVVETLAAIGKAREQDGHASDENAFRAP